jgi:hypothetical protein
VFDRLLITLSVRLHAFSVCRIQSSAFVQAEGWLGKIRIAPLRSL